MTGPILQVQRWSGFIARRSTVDYAAQTQHSWYRPQGSSPFPFNFDALRSKLVGFRDQNASSSAISFWVTIVSQTFLPKQTITSHPRARFVNFRPERALYVAYRWRKEAATLRLVTAMLGLGQTEWWINFNGRQGLRPEARRRVQSVSVLGTSATPHCPRPPRCAAHRRTRRNARTHRNRGDVCAGAKGRYPFEH
jgi:hypothetical protein